MAGAGAWSSAAGAVPGPSVPGLSFPGAAPSALAGAPGDVAIQWNLIAQNVLQPPMQMGAMPAMPGMSMPRAFVVLSYAHAAMYNAVVAIEGGYQPWMVATTAPAGASAPAAAAAAVHAVLVAHVPAQKDMLDMELWDTLTVLGSASGDRAKGTAVGRAAAQAVLSLRAGDGLDAPVTYAPARAPGVWEPFPTPTTPPLDPWVATMRPFVLSSPSQFRPGPPPTLRSRTHVQDLEEVRLYGGRANTPGTTIVRTPEQTEVALFWQTNGVIQYNEMFRAVARRQGLGLLEAARFLALGNLIGTDSMVAAFDAKYHYGHWRPWSAIRRADEDGSAVTVPDPAWAHLAMLPNHPEYVAAHTTFASAIAELLTAILGTRSIGIELTSTTTGMTPTTYRYATAEDLRSQVINARTWGGLHFRNSSVLGNDVGQRVAVHALRNHFRPAARR